MKEITEVKINLNDEKYVTKFIVGFTQKTFLKRLKELGEDCLEENKIFAILFETTPPDRISEIESYGEVLRQFPDSNRILDKKFYIGNFNDREKTYKQVLSQLCNNGKYEIIEVIE